MRARPFVALALTALVGGLVLWGCGGGGGGGAALTDPEVLLVNLTADAGKLRLLIDDDEAANNIAYLKRAADYFSFPAKEDPNEAHDVSLTTPDGSDEYDIQAFQFSQNFSNLAVAFGIKNYAPGDELKRLRFVLVEASREAPIGNRARLLVFHGFNRSAGLSTPSLDFQSPGDNPLVKLDDITYGANQEVTVDSGASDWVMKRGDGEAVYASASVNLAAGAWYLVALTGIEGDPDPAKRPKITFIRLPTE
jgi:hypothetical protein